MKVPTNNDDDNDCFQKFGLSSSSKVSNRRGKRTTSKTQIAEVSQSVVQPAHLVEEIDAIVSLILYNTYSKQHEFTLSPQHRVRFERSTRKMSIFFQGKRPIIPNPLRDESDRFTALYSCLYDEMPDKHRLNEILRDRFYSLSDVDELKKFEAEEYPRILEEKRLKRRRIPFIPNIFTFQRTCLDDEIEHLKWIRENLC